MSEEQEQGIGRVSCSAKASPSLVLSSLKVRGVWRERWKEATHVIQKPEKKKKGWGNPAAVRLTRVREEGRQHLL